MLSKSAHDACLWQSKVCIGMGAPLSGEVLRLIAEHEAVSAAFAPLFASAQTQSAKDLVTGAHPLRALGGLHFIVLSGRSDALAARYAQSGAGDLAGAIVAAVSEHGPLMRTFMASPPQTNEVRRALCLLGGFLLAAEETGLPLRCLEIGASAGLNQFWDRFSYDLGPLGRWGDAASPVRLAGDWTGAAPPLHVAARVVERAACDQRPVNIVNEVEALRLLAYVWPDQPERLARARAAIDLARRAGVAVQQADAADWTRAHAAPKVGMATVLYHSIFWQYPPPETRAAIIANIHAAGAAAARSAPFAWLRMEPGLDNALLTEVRLTTWPGGHERLLAVVHPHGATVDWRLGTNSVA